MTVLCLAHGRFTLIDDEDWERVNQYRWHTTWASGRWYVRRWGWIKVSKKQIGIFLHRELMGATGDVIVDHENRDSLDNRKGNLRVCDHRRNNANATKSISNTSGFKGVAKARGGRWRVNIGRNIATRHLGVFDDVIEAAKAYDAEAVRRYGEFALTNKSMGLF